MNEKIGRNDPCPCGSGKKYKQCCLKNSSAGRPLKFKAKVLSGQGQQLPFAKKPDLMDRAFGEHVKHAQNNPPPKPKKDA